MNRKGIICIAFAVIFIINGTIHASSENPRDGQYYFEQLKESIFEILEENQKLFNTKADGTVKNNSLIPPIIYKNIYQMFKRIEGKDFNMNEIKGETAPEKTAPVLAAFLQSGRVTIAKIQKDINIEPDGSVKLKKFIPAVFGRLTIDRFYEKTGVIMKQTTLGNSGYTVRNPENAPDEWEKEALKKFLSPGWKLNQGIGGINGDRYRYIKPIYIKKGCLVCHGKPAGEKGPYGHPKEGYDTGDIRGGISVQLPSDISRQGKTSNK